MLPSSATRQQHAALIASLGGAVSAIPTNRADTLLALGHLGPLPCWSMEGPPAHAIAVARDLARRGQPGLLLADDRESDRRTVVIGITPVRPAVMALDDTGALPLVRLRRLEPRTSLLDMAIGAAAALDVDAAGRRAFRALRSVVEATVDNLDGRIRREERHAWVLLQVTRLLFLRFVESEGWLDGNPAFLAREIDAVLTRGGDPAAHLLHPLFFGTLNREPAARTRRAAAFGRVPFLNGGLFEPHPVERRRAWRLPADRWQALFEPIVAAIEVSLDAGDVGDRVNPELLGRVFEGVMDPVERRAAGTYYTPAALVPPLVREAYACHLAGRLGRDESSVHEALDDPDPELSAALLDLRVLDPAVGSGAFLVGALQLARGPARGAVRRTRRLVGHCLFGVDRNPSAVRLTELRLWLEVLRAMRGRPTERVAPLPNLDTTVRAGDALLDPLAGTTLSGRFARQLERARLAAQCRHGKARYSAIRQLRALESEALGAALSRNEGRLQQALSDLLDSARARTLFGDRDGLPRSRSARLRALRRAIATLRRERQRLATEAGAPVFAIESAFAPELRRGGFDLVLGNPPWVRAERLPPEVRTALHARYRWWRGSGTGWQHLPDLSVAFLERATEMVATGGTIGFLLPAKLATARYAATCRAAMLHRTTVHVAADLSTDPRAGFEATTYPMAVIATRRAPPSGHHIRTGLGPGAPTVAQESWRTRGSWLLAGSRIIELAAALTSRCGLLRDHWSPALGLKTGANAVFLDPPDALEQWTRPVVRGRDLASGHVAGRHRLLWPADERGCAWRELPDAVADYLTPQRTRLERRADLRDGPWWQFFRTGPATAQWRVAWADLATTLRPAPLGEDAPVPLNSCYVIPCRSAAEMRLLAAWLGSMPIRSLARLDAEPAANGYARFGARAVGGTPFPASALSDRVLNRITVGADASPAEIDARVAQLLGIGADETRLLDEVITIGR